MISLLDSNNKSNYPVEHINDVSSDTVIKTFTFDSLPENLEYSQPITLTTPHGTFQVKRWSEVLGLCYKYAFQNNQIKVESLADIEAPFQKTILFSRNKEKIRHAAELSSNLYAEKNFSAYRIAKIVCSLMAYCGFPVKSFSITYKKSCCPNQRTTKKVPLERSIIPHGSAGDIHDEEATLPKQHEAFLRQTSFEEDSTKNELAELLQAEFTNGVRPCSVIDQKKIRRLYQQYFDAELPDNFDFVSVLPQLGIVHNGKVYPKLTANQIGWRSLIEKLVLEGHTIFQFSRLMELYADELMKSGIMSSELFQKIMIRDMSDSYDIFGDFFTPKGHGGAFFPKLFASAFLPEDEAIIDVLATSRRFPYVDIAFIRNWYKGLDNLVRIGQDMYAIVDRIEFDDIEIARGSSHCEMAIKTDGFFSLAQLSLDNSAAMNSLRLTDSALRRIFFQRFLSDKFDIQGQIVCTKGTSIDGQIPLHVFLREHSDVMLDQLEIVAKEYNICLGLALKAAHEEMVRVERDRFVTPRMVSFDVEAIDESIANVCEDSPAPFGLFVNNLSNFPAVPGWTWNEYLLESFLRRSSARFRLLSPPILARDVSGAIVPCSSSDCNIENAFAIIALRAGIAAETEGVGNFLVATQCILRRTSKTLGAVVSKMKELEKH